MAASTPASEASMARPDGWAQPNRRSWPGVELRTCVVSTSARYLANTGRETLTDQDGNGLHTVPPGELLALLAGPGGVLDGDLIGPDVGAQQFAGDFGFHPEPCGIDVQRPVELEGQ